MHTSVLLDRRHDRSVQTATGHSRNPGILVIVIVVVSSGPWEGAGDRREAGKHNGEALDGELHLCRGAAGKASGD